MSPQFTVTANKIYTSPPYATYAHLLRGFAEHNLPQKWNYCALFCFGKGWCHNDLLL